MKDVFEQLQDAERRFFGDEDRSRESSKCHFCEEYFHPEEMTRVGEQVIRKKYYRNARSCYGCAPLDPD